MTDLIKAIEKASELSEEIKRTNDEDDNFIAGIKYQHSQLQWALDALKIAVEKLNEGLVTIERRQKSDDVCDHPFDEDLGYFANELREALKQIAALIPGGK